ncbi:MAG: DUF692 family multinuclear iron-containing protein [Candidatus Dechloromonas phosphoritropha]|jgi:hypothetical protein
MHQPQFNGESLEKAGIVTLTVCSTFVAAALTSLAHAVGDKPFGATKLEAGYQLAQADSKKMDAPRGAEMNEGEFISAIVSAADCLPHLGIGNIFVNGRNFGCDRHAFIDALPLEHANVRGQAHYY